MHKYLALQLQHDDVLSHLSSALRAELLQVAKLRRVDKGQMIYRKGDSPDGLLRLITGQVRVGAVSSGGNEFLFTTMMPGDWFGEISVLDGLPRTHDAIAAQDCEFAAFSVTKLRRLCEQHAAIKNLIISLMCSHIRAAFLAIDDFLLLTPEQRMAKRICEMAEKQAGNSRINLSQQQLSELMGLSRQSVSKILKTWESEGLIQRVYGGLDLLNPHGLAQQVPT